MGFVKIPNDLTEWAWANDNNTLAVYIRLLLNAAWKDRDYKNVNIRRGQVVATLPQIAEQSSLTIQQVRTIIDRLKSTGKITVERTAKFSIITLLEYDIDTANNSQDNSQDFPQNEQKQQSNNSLSTDKQQSNNSLSTDKQQSPYINRNTESKKVRKSEGQKEREGARTKKKFAENVTLTEEEYSQLVEEHGEEVIKWCVKKLDDYKNLTGKAYASDYKAILSWVLESYQEDQAKKKAQAEVKPPGEKSRNPFINAVLNGGGGDG